MKKYKWLVVIVIMLLVFIVLSIYANFKVAPYVTNVEITESKKFNDKVIVNVYVDNYFFNLTNEEVKANIKNKLYRYQQEIKNIGNEETGWKLYNFEFDLNDNQHTLFKRKDHYRYEDAGQIWVRMKNFPLSMPLMNRNVVIDLKDIKYQNDVYDTLLCN